MVRTTARQAYTRSRASRERKRVESTRELVEGRRKYIRQLASLRDLSYGNNNTAPHDNPQPDRTTSKPSTSKSTVRNRAEDLRKKITDFFPKVSHPEYLLTKIRSSRPIHTTSFVDPDGTETITIHDSEDDENVRTSPDVSLSAQQFSSGTSSPYEQSVKAEPVQSNLSLDGLTLRLEEDIEIVDILPPIPLRDHPVFDLDE